MTDRAESGIWLADLTHTGRGTATDTMPLGIAFLAAYLGKSDRYPVRLFRYPHALSAALERGVPALVGFASYTWNAKLSRAYARAVKRAYPATIVVFGGPNLPLSGPEQAAFLAEDDYIDLYVEREGESAFAAVVRAFRDGARRREEFVEAAPSVLTVTPGGQLLRSEPAPRLQDLDTIPSPYLTGLLDQFFDGTLVPTIQTNRGCPFSCAFCLEGERYFSKVASFSQSRVRQELEYIAEHIQPVLGRGGRNELMITDSNFGMYPQDEGICEVIGLLSRTVGWPQRVNVTTGKNKRDRILAAVGKAGGTIQLSGAVQSLDEQVLANIRRSNIRSDQLLELAASAARSATSTYSDVILGLPGDTRAAHEETVLTLVEGGFGRVNTFQFALLPGAEVNTPQTRRKFGMRTRFRVVPRGFGRYRVLGEDLIAAEVDEVCVESDSMTFGDYLQSRLFDLVVFLFHNDGMFLATQAALRTAGVRVRDWLMAIAYDTEWREGLASLRDSFLVSTREQLFTTEAELLADVRSRIGDYLSGDAGNNLLYSYRARALRDHVSGLGRVAALAAEGLAPCAQASAVLAEAVRFDTLSLSGLFDRRPIRVLTADFNYDLPRLVATRSDVVLSREHLTIDFVLPDKVADLVENYQQRLGRSADGLGRALSRLRIDELRRVASIRDLGPAQSSPAQVPYNVSIPTGSLNGPVSLPGKRV